MNWKAWVCSFMGYTTEEAARSDGYSHHGYYYGIPIYIADPHSDCRVEPKWSPMTLLMSVFIEFEHWSYVLFFPDEKPAFRIALGKSITKES